MIEIPLLILSVIILAKASDVCVENSIALSNMIGISETTIGFILIAIVTSLPELLITIFASIEGSVSLTLGTLVGSNIANVCLVFALPALIISYNFFKKDIEQIHYVITITSIIMIFALILKIIDPGFGIFLVLLFFITNFTIIKASVSERIKFKTLEAVKKLFISLLAIVVVIITSYIATRSSIAVAQAIGINEIVIGFTILAVGSSLPEIAIGISAIKKGNYGLAIGDTIGSLLTNLTLILGIGSIIKAIIIDFVSSISILILLTVNILFLQIIKRKNMGRREGLGLIIIYVLSTYLLIQASF